MQLFTALLLALALATSTTTAGPILARQYNFTKLQFSYPLGGETWLRGSSQNITWDPSQSGMKDLDPNLHCALYLGNNATGSENINSKLLPNLLWW
jgi:hypothetical protein